jgi:fluoride ion exporter CrcB/FEX
MRDHELALASMYVLLSNVLGIALVFGGFVLARSLFGFAR